MLKARVLTALVLLAGFFAALFWLPPLGWKLFVAIVVCLAGWEWAGLSRFSEVLRSGYALALALALVALAGVAFQHRADAPLMIQRGVVGFAYILAAGFWLLLTPAWLAQKWLLANRAVAAAVGILVLLPAGLAMVHLRELSPFLLLAAMAAVWVADIAAYFVGRRFGRRRLAPGISPGKTWEGAAGALAGVLVYGLSLAAADRHAAGLGAGGWAAFALWLALLTAVSIVGDLFESLMKRQAGVKDSGSLLPGHGGVLDRIDSQTSVLPLVGLLVLYWRSPA